MTVQTTACPPAVLESAGLSHARIAQLAEDHQAAAAAVCAPDVHADLMDAARDAARSVGLDVADPRVVTVLLTLASRSYAHGHMDALDAAREQATVTPLAWLLDPKGTTR